MQILAKNPQRIPHSVARCHRRGQSPWNTHTHTHTHMNKEKGQRGREEKKKRKNSETEGKSRYPNPSVDWNTQQPLSAVVVVVVACCSGGLNTHTHRHRHTPDHLYPLIHNGVASLWMPINLTCKIFTWNLLDSRKKDGQKGKSFVTILNQLISFNLVHDWLVIQRGSNVTENFAFFHHVHSIQNLLKRIFKLIRNNRFFAPVDMI